MTNTTPTPTPTPTVTAANIAAVTDSTAAAYCMRRAKGAWDRREVTQAQARTLWTLAQARRDELLAAEGGGCSHGQATRADCNTCALGGAE